MIFLLAIYHRKLLTEMGDVAVFPTAWSHPLIPQFFNFNVITFWFYLVQVYNCIHFLVADSFSELVFTFLVVNTNSVCC